MVKGWVCRKETFREGEHKCWSRTMLWGHTTPLPPHLLWLPLFPSFHYQFFKIIVTTLLLPNGFTVGLGSYHQWKKYFFQVAINLSVACLQHRCWWLLALCILFLKFSPFLGSQQLSVTQLLIFHPPPPIISERNWRRQKEMERYLVFVDWKN